MKRFNFKLEKLLEYRASLELKGKEEFAQVLKKSVLIEKKIENIVLKQNILKKNYSYFSKENNLSMLFYYDKSMQALKIQMKQCQLKLKKQEENLTIARNKLRKLINSRKSIEILKNKAFFKYNESVKKEELEELDFFGLNCYLNKKNKLNKN